LQRTEEHESEVAANTQATRGAKYSRLKPLLRFVPGSFLCDDFQTPRILIEHKPIKRGWTLMRTLKLAVIAVLVTFAAATFADEEHQMKFEIIVAEDGADESTKIHWSSDNADFDMQDMQVGESRSIVDDEGRAILITRAADGFKMDIDGKTIELPELPGMGPHGAHMAFVDGGDMDIDVQVIGAGDFTTSGGPEGVTVITDEALDESTKASIRAVLQSAGRDDEVTFIDGSGGSDGKHVKIIRKHVEMVN